MYSFLHRIKPAIKVLIGKSPKVKIIGNCAIDGIVEMDGTTSFYISGILMIHNRDNKPVIIDVSNGATLEIGEECYPFLTASPIRDLKGFTKAKPLVHGIYKNIAPRE
jgi:hypothetical protein